MNQNFIEELKLFRIAKRDQAKFSQDMIDAYDVVRRTLTYMQKECMDELDTLDERIISTRELLLAGKIEPSDFKNLKIEYSDKVHAINLRLTALKHEIKMKIDIQPLIISTIKTICNLPHLYQNATIEDKRYLVETIFYGELLYDSDGYRTTNLNTIAEITYLKNKELKMQKKGEKYL